MTLHQLKVFAAVAKYKSITVASQHLHMTQPAVSIQVKQLESHYDLALIEVIGKRVHLTEAGERVRQAYQQIAASLSHLEMEISQLRGCLSGKLSIAVVSTAKYFIPALLGEFHRQYPQVDIQLKVTNREEVIKRLQDNLDDVVVLSQLPKKISIIAKELLEDALVIPAPPDHPLAKKQDLSLKQLLSEPFIIREVGSGTRMVMERWFKKYHFSPRVIMELGSSSAIKQAIMAGIGLSMISKMSIEQELALKKLIVLDIKNFPVKHPWYVVYPKGKILTPVASNFLKFLSEHAQ